MKIVERRGSNDLIFLVDLHAHIHNMFFFFFSEELKLISQKKSPPLQHTPSISLSPHRGIRVVCTKVRTTRRPRDTTCHFAEEDHQLCNLHWLRYFFFFQIFLGRERMHHTYPVRSGQFEVSDGSGWNRTGLPKELAKRKCHLQIHLCPIQSAEKIHRNSQ